jgi:hypothetical protein
LIELIDIGRPVMPINRDDEREPDSGFSRGDRDREDGKHHTRRRSRLRSEPPEGDEIQSRGSEHHLNADENKDGVTPTKCSHKSDAKKRRRDDKK